MESSLPKLSLHYLCRRPATDRAHPPILFLLHGFGSNEENLFRLAVEMPPEFLVLSVRSPQVLGEDQYAWFSIDFSTGKPVHNKTEALESIPLLKQFMDEAIATFAADTNEVYMLGFSQGAMMSYSIALMHQGFVKGVAALSGRVLREIRPMVPVLDAHKKLRVFVGHGSEDQVLSISHAREAKEYLLTLGITPEYHEYPIAHSISRTELLEVKEWLTSQLES
jgi:phospholipase/carboxylesterase